MSEKRENLKLTGDSYKSVFKILPHPIYLWQKIGEDLILIDYNKAAEVITEGKIRTLVGIKASEQYKDSPIILEDLRRCLTNKTNISREIVHKLVTTGKERDFIRVYEFIEPDLVLAHTEDLTQQRLAEKSLRKEEKEKSMILDAVSDHIIYYNTDQDIIWANQAAIDSVNLTYEEVVSKKCYEIWQNRKEPCEFCPVLKALETGKTQHSELRSPDGRVWFIRGFPVWDDDGNIIGMVEITRDITAQKYVEENLQRERDILGRITDTSPVGINVINKVGKIIFANPQAEKILGLTKNEITQRSYNAPSWRITDYDGNPFPDDELPFQKVKNTRESVFDVRHAIQWPNGQKRYLSINASPILDENQKFDGMVGTIEDSTEKWMIDQKLRESEEKYRTLFENMKAAFALHKVIVDENNKPVDYKYIEANPAFEKMTGLKVNEIIGKTVTEVLPGMENDPADWIGKFGNVGLTGVPLTLEDYSEQINRWFKVSGYSPKKGYFAVTFNDITERKKAEQKLIESEENFRTISEQFLMGICIIQDYEVKYVNQQMVDIYGYSYEEVYNWKTKDFFKVLHNDSKDFVIEQIRKKQQGSKDVKNHYISKAIKKDGSTIWVENYSKSIIYQGKPADLLTQIDITDKKVAEQKLIESEEKFRKIAEQSFMGIGIIQDNQVKYVNDEIAEILEYSVEEMMKWTKDFNITNMIHPQDLQRLKDQREQRRASEFNLKPYVSYRVISKSGKVKWIDQYSKNIIYQGRDAELITIMDITNKKIAEQKLKDSKQFLQNFFNAIQDGISVLDTDLNIIRVNPWIEKMYSSNSPLIGKKCYEVYQNRSSICPWCPSVITIETGEKHTEVVPYPSAETPTGWIDLTAYPIKDEKGNVVNVIEYVKDITKQKKAEYKLRESEEKYRDMAELLPDVIFEADLNMNLKYVNPAGYDMFGYSPQDIENGINFNQLLTSDSLKEAEKRIKEISLGKTTSPNEYELLKKDGRKFNGRVHSRPIIKDGKIIGLRGTVTDITDIKLAEEKLKEKNLELSVLNRIIKLGNESQSLREFLEKSYDQVLDIVGFDRGGVYLYDSETQHNILILHKNVHPDFIVSVKNVDISEGIYNTLFDKEKPFYIEDFSEFIENSKELGVYSAIIVPLRSKDEYVGSLNIGSPIHQNLSYNELKLLLAIGKQMGIIIQKFESEQLLKTSEEKYREAYNRIYLYKDLFTHDISNIFQNILSSNELAMLYSNIPEKLQDYVEVANLIKEQVSRGAKLVSNVQKLSELEEFKKPMYSIEVYSVLQNVIASIKKNFLHKKIDISIHSIENQYLFKANELIFDVFENLIINAVKHNRNPTIEIQIKISQNLIDDINYVKIEFIDNGIGIPDIMKDVIFQRDVKKENASGIGLGLLLIKRILDSYEGTVKVEDRILGDYSKGSNFIVLIPKA